MGEDKKLGRIRIPDYNHGEKGIFLLNTGVSRKTDSFVNLFLEKMKNIRFKEMVKKKLLPVTNSCIGSLLEEKIGELSRSFQELSRLQSEHFSPMIPGVLQDIWGGGFALRGLLPKILRCRWRRFLPRHHRRFG